MNRLRKKNLLSIGLLVLLVLSVGNCRRRPNYKFELRTQPDGTFVAQLPRGDWYDTGLILGPNKQLDTATTPESAAEAFSVRVGDIPEVVADVTNDRCCGITITSPETMGDQHVFMKLPDSASADFVLVKISIGEPKGP